MATIGMVAFSKSERYVFRISDLLELLQTCLNSRTGMQALWDQEASAVASVVLLEA